MEITVCIKQVPGTSEVKVDPETGVLQRDGIESKMNPYDLYAIETALRLKEQYSGNVRALTMGAASGGRYFTRSVYDGSRRWLFFFRTGVLPERMSWQLPIH